MKELETILVRYQGAGATLGDHKNKNEDGPLAPRLGRDLELALTRMRGRERWCYGGAGVLFVALLTTHITSATAQPLVSGAMIAGMAWTLDYVRRLSREQDAMDLVLALCQSADEPAIAAVIAGAQRRRATAPGSGHSLTFDEVCRLHAVAVDLRLDRDRDALLGGIDPSVVAALPPAHNPSAQILSDLHELNRVAVDGDVPLRCWLNNAIRLRSQQPKKATFDQCLHRLAA